MGDMRVRGGSLDVDVAHGLIARSSPGPVLDATGLTVLPGLIDLQVNGAAGLDVTAQPERLWDVGAALAAYGVTGWLPTVITSEPRARDQALATISAGPPVGWVGALPLGLHFEGPMIAHGRRGAHPEQWLRPPSLDLVEGWSRDAGVTMVTLAPELPGALDIIEALVGRGVVVSIGHTAACTADVTAAVAAGARCVTHLGNAMAPMLAREPGPVGAAFAGSDLVAGVICDGHHVHDDFLRTAWRALGSRRLLLVSDTTAALGLPDGVTRLGDQEVFVADGTVRLADGTLAGSAASLLACLQVLRSVTGCALDEAVATATITPAAVLGDSTRGRIATGLRGDLTLVDDRLTPVVTVVGGAVAYDARAH